ncbi:MAG: transcriptional regulator [Planctomycetota bacterium]|nr:MAG: transcriptional regulator [Planctomycetota bacterium]
MPEADDAQPLEGLDRLVHEPARLIVLATLSVVDTADAPFLLKQTGLTWGNLSSHLSKLERAGYVQIEKVFVDRRPRTLLTLSDPGREALRRYREQMQRLLGELPD